MSISSPQDVFESSLQKLLYAKKDGVRVQNDLTQETTDSNTLESLQGHSQVTQKHVEAIEELLSRQGFEPTPVQSQGVDSLTEECMSMIQSAEDEVSKNALVSEAILKLESLEIAMLNALSLQVTLLGLEQQASESVNSMLSDDQGAFESAIKAASQLA